MFSSLPVTEFIVSWLLCNPEDVGGCLWIVEVAEVTESTGGAAVVPVVSVVDSGMTLASFIFSVSNDASGLWEQQYCYLAALQSLVRIIV